MIRFTLAGVPVRVHVALLLMIALAQAMGMGPECTALFIALAIHEGAHFACARLLGVAVEEAECTPFGAVLHMGSLWTEGAMRVALVALSGPAANLLAMMAAGLGAYMGWLRPNAAWLSLRANSLLLANLLPALPLDGGRAACALAQKRWGPLRAARWGSVAGCVAAAALGLLCLWMGLRYGRWNVTLLASGAYICACALREPQMAQGASARALLLRREELLRLGSLPVEIVAIPQETDVVAAMKLIRPGKVRVFQLYDENMHVTAQWSEADLLFHGENR